MPRISRRQREKIWDQQRAPRLPAPRWTMRQYYAAFRPVGYSILHAYEGSRDMVYRFETNCSGKRSTRLARPLGILP